jgi:hypothetical protein
MVSFSRTWCFANNLFIRQVCVGNVIKIWSTFISSILYQWVKLKGKIKPYKGTCLSFSARQWFSPGPRVSSTNKTDCHDITEILLKVTLNTITPTPTVTLIYAFYTKRKIWTEIWLQYEEPYWCAFSKFYLTQKKTSNLWYKTISSKLKTNPRCIKYCHIIIHCDLHLWTSDQNSSFDN